ncbi:LuxR C-terminal-related transcriptional regulator [Actinomadura sp. K4S16]|uniref:helix-turn-helix transcriptional regulator n=1 Tax=Actinomadura sp. K4S16 TaxID=1316147 RepID=UPI00135C46BD|nr:LuxR C-terminal-related transcriptional regulator [Actinomadura sp. K4S16]
MRTEQFARARDRLLREVTAETPMVTVLNETVAALHAVTRFSWCAVMTADPRTLLPTGGVVEGFSPDACGPFWDNELLAPGFNKFNTLARSTDPVATLFEATDGDLARAPIYTDLYAPLGVADELRAAFVVGGRCWGVAALLRASADGPFPRREVEHVQALLPLITRSVKSSACRLEADAGSPTAMVVVDGSNGIRDLTVEAGELLDDLRTTGVDEPGLPTILGTVATRARSTRTANRLVTRVRGRSGRWFRVTAGPMQDGAGDVAMVIEPARAADLTPILLESYRLTERETEIVMLLARGLTTREIAAALTLSAHTVRDHIKAVFGKTGTTTRGELVARLFAEHLLDGFHNAVHRAV